MMQTTVPLQPPDVLEWLCGVDGDALAKLEIGEHRFRTFRKGS